jgi:uncharacterized protein YrzB (UPF0473 family)
MGNESFLTVLVDEEGNEEEFLRLADIEVEGESYAILVSETDDLVHILRIEAEEKGEELLVVVEDDDEFDRVVDALKTLVENGDLDIDIDFDDEYDYDDYDDDDDDDDDDE